VGVVLFNVGVVFTVVAHSFKYVFEVAATTGLVAVIVAAVFVGVSYAFKSEVKAAAAANRPAPLRRLAARLAAVWVAFLGRAAWLAGAFVAVLVVIAVGQGLTLVQFRAQLEDLRDTSLTFEINLSTFGTHPRVNLGHNGYKSKLKLSGKGQSQLKLSRNGNECKPLPWGWS